MSSPANMKDLDIVQRRKSIKDIEDKSIDLDKGAHQIDFSEKMDFRRIKIRKNTSPNASQTLDSSFKGHHTINNQYQVDRSYHLNPRDTKNTKKRVRNRSKISEKKSFDNLSYTTIDPSRIDMSRLYNKRMLKSHINNFVNGGRSYTQTHQQKRRVDYMLKTEDKILHVIFFPSYPQKHLDRAKKRRKRVRKLHIDRLDTSNNSNTRMYKSRDSQNTR